MSDAPSRPVDLVAPRGRAGAPYPVRASTREQRTTIVYGILSITLVVVILQLWLFTATMNAYLGGDEEVILPGALASAFCLLLNVGLLRYLGRLDRR